MLRLQIMEVSCAHYQKVGATNYTPPPPSGRESESLGYHGS